MRDNCNLANEGFKVLHPVMAAFIGKQMKAKYGSSWWSQVRDILDDHDEELPVSGEEEFLINSLDRANCIRILERRWKEVFQEHIMHPAEKRVNCRVWIKELMGVRNAIAHETLNDISLHDTERALDTMMLVCDELRPSETKKIKEFYDAAREKSLQNGDAKEENVEYIYPVQDYVSQKTNDGTPNLFNLIGTEWVKPTGLTRKITLDNNSVAYPVYGISLEECYYNDQNDRIATWIAKYKAEHGEDSIDDLAKNRGDFNDVIETFIIDSNPDALRKTKNSIKAVDQREPGVVLSDGRIVDGNRRYTCLRQLQEEEGTPYYFEAVILGNDFENDKKQIKKLELALQHGEEKKVDYDLIDFAIGTYHDIVKTKLLTIKEYAESANESTADVKKRIAIAEIITEFLEYVKLPEHYHVARELQVYSVFEEMLAPLNSLKDADKQATLKKITFNNILLKATIDQRKFIRDIKQIIKTGKYEDYFTRKLEINKEIHAQFDDYEVSSKDDLDEFAKNNEDIAEEMRKALSDALEALRRIEIKVKPIENIKKSVTLVKEIDKNLFSTLSDEEKTALLNEIKNLETELNDIKAKLK